MENTDPKPKVDFIMLAGLPGSGKTTFAQLYIQSNPQFVLISTDKIIDAMADANGWTYTETFAKYDFDIFEQQMKAELADAVSMGKPIIWDQTNLTVKSRKNKLAMIPKDKYIRYCKVFDITDEELADRINNRAAETGKDIPSKVLADMKRTMNLNVQLSEGFDYIL